MAASPPPVALCTSRPAPPVLPAADSQQLRLSGPAPGAAHSGALRAATDVLDTVDTTRGGLVRPAAELWPRSLAAQVPAASALELGQGKQPPLAMRRQQLRERPMRLADVSGQQYSCSLAEVISSLERELGAHLGSGEVRALCCEDTALWLTELPWQQLNQQPSLCFVVPAEAFADGERAAVGAAVVRALQRLCKGAPPKLSMPAMSSADGSSYWALRIGQYGAVTEIRIGSAQVALSWPKLAWAAGVVPFPTGDAGPKPPTGPLLLADGKPAVHAQRHLADGTYGSARELNGLSMDRLWQARARGLVPSVADGGEHQLLVKLVDALLEPGDSDGKSFALRLAEYLSRAQRTVVPSQEAALLANAIVVLSEQGPMPGRVEAMRALRQRLAATSLQPRAQEPSVRLAVLTDDNLEGAGLWLSLLAEPPGDVHRPWPEATCVCSSGAQRPYVRAFLPALGGWLVVPQVADAAALATAAMPVPTDAMLLAPEQAVPQLLLRTKAAAAAASHLTAADFWLAPQRLEAMSRRLTTWLAALPPGQLAARARIVLALCHLEPQRCHADALMAVADALPSAAEAAPYRSLARAQRQRALLRAAAPLQAAQLDPRAVEAALASCCVLLAGAPAQERDDCEHLLQATLVEALPKAATAALPAARPLIEQFAKVLALRLPKALLAARKRAATQLAKRPGAPLIAAIDDFLARAPTHQHGEDLRQMQVGARDAASAIEAGKFDQAWRHCLLHKGAARELPGDLAAALLAGVSPQLLGHHSALAHQLLLGAAAGPPAFVRLAFDVRRFAPLANSASNLVPLAQLLDGAKQELPLAVLEAWHAALSRVPDRAGGLLASMHPGSAAWLVVARAGLRQYQSPGDVLCAMATLSAARRAARMDDGAGIASLVADGLAALEALPHAPYWAAQLPGRPTQSDVERWNQCLEALPGTQRVHAKQQLAALAVDLGEARLGLRIVLSLWRRNLLDQQLKQAAQNCIVAMHGNGCSNDTSEAALVENQYLLAAAFALLPSSAWRQPIWQYLAARHVLDCLLVNQDQLARGLLDVVWAAADARFLFASLHQLVLASGHLQLDQPLQAWGVVFLREASREHPWAYFLGLTLGQSDPALLCVEGAGYRHRCRLHATSPHPGDVAEVGRGLELVAQEPMLAFFAKSLRGGGVLTSEACLHLLPTLAAWLNNMSQAERPGAVLKVLALLDVQAPSGLLADADADADADKTTSAARAPSRAASDAELPSALPYLHTLGPYVARLLVGLSGHILQAVAQGERGRAVAWLARLISVPTAGVDLISALYGQAAAQGGAPLQEALRAALLAQLDQQLSEQDEDGAFATAIRLVSLWSADDAQENVVVQAAARLRVFKAIFGSWQRFGAGFDEALVSLYRWAQAPLNARAAQAELPHLAAIVRPSLSLKSLVLLERSEPSEHPSITAACCDGVLAQLQSSDAACKRGGMATFIDAFPQVLAAQPEQLAYVTERVRSMLQLVPEKLAILSHLRAHLDRLLAHAWGADCCAWWLVQLQATGRMNEDSALSFLYVLDALRQLSPAPKRQQLVDLMVETLRGADNSSLRGADERPKALWDYKTPDKTTSGAVCRQAHTRGRKLARTWRTRLIGEQNVAELRAALSDFGW